MPQSAKSSKSKAHSAVPLDPMSQMRQSFEQFLSVFQSKEPELSFQALKPLELDASLLEQLQSEFVERASRLWNDSLNHGIN